MAERDSQRGKVWKLIRDKGTPLNNKEALKFATSIVQSRWWGTREPRYRAAHMHQSIHPCVPEGMRASKSLGISSKCYNDLKVIEALAHWLAKGEQPPGVQSWHHGPAFALIFLNMVKRFAPDKYEDIRGEFKIRKIKRRTVSEEAVLEGQTRRARQQLERMIGELTGE